MFISSILAVKRTVRYNSLIHESKGFDDLMICFLVQHTKDLSNKISEIIVEG